MIEPPVPFDEASRLATLRGLNILDTPREERFDRLTRLAQHLIGVPIAVVSLVDSDRQWFKSCQGLDASETPRSISFCGHAVLGDQLFVIPDALLDPRFADNPLVTGAPCIRFYAGQPLKALNGSKMGTLCVIDSKPHQLTQTECDGLRDLAILVENELNVLDYQEATRALLNSEKHLNAVLENILDGIITIDDHGSIASFNRAAEKIFGFTAQEVTGHNVKMLMPEPYHNEHDGYLHNFNTTGEKKIIGIGRQVVGRRKDGSTFPMDLAVSEMQLNDQRMFTGIVRDITERVNLERLKGEFVSIVSHELRTPLTAIAGALGLILGGAMGAVQEQMRQMIDIAHRNSLRLTFLINDLLDMEKLTAGKMDFDMQRQALMPLIEQSLESNHTYGVSRRVSLVLASSVPGVEVMVDGQRLLQVLSNLISNAIKYSPEDGMVGIAVQIKNSAVHVSCTDHGPGIPEEFRCRIFQRFAQADSSDARQKGGTGLGLAITRELIDRMGGQIGFDSVEGQGACFYFDLPLA